MRSTYLPVTLNENIFTLHLHNWIKIYDSYPFYDQKITEYLKNYYKSMHEIIDTVFVLAPCVESSTSGWNTAHITKLTSMFKGATFFNSRI